MVRDWKLPEVDRADRRTGHFGRLFPVIFGLDSRQVLTATATSSSKALNLIQPVALRTFESCLSVP